MFRKNRRAPARSRCYIRLMETQSDPRWADVTARNATCDGQFFYAVRTTGVYCRPSCPSRLPRPENVTFHLTPASAEAAGFRPCKRCHPARSAAQ